MLEWHLHLFGSVKLSGGDGEISKFLTVRCAKLLVLLGLASGSKIRRVVAAQLLWPEDPPDSSRLRLRQEIHRLKSSLGPAGSLIGSSPDEIWLHREQLRTDLDLLAEGHALSEIPSGEFLPGWYEPWVIAERAQADAVRVEYLVQTSRKYLAAGDAEAALAVVLPFSREDPLQETLRLLVVEAYSQMGKLASAVSEYQDYRRVVREQLGVELDPTAPIAVREKPAPAPVRTDRWESLIPSPSDETLGRDALIDQVVHEFRSNPRLRVITLVGPGGIGKTRLATEVIHQLKGEGSARTAFVTFAEFDEAGDWARHMATQLEIEIPEAAVPDVYLANQLSIQPVILVVDNLETILPEHLSGLESFLRRAPQVRMLGTSRLPARLSGERVITVGPVSPLEDGLKFLRRGLSPNATRSLSKDEEASLTQIATQLDGYPLALKLAAARLRLLRPSELLTLLGSSLTTSRESELAARHRSLEVSLDSSLASLGERQRQALERIAAYPGGMCTQLAAIEFEDANYLDVIEELLDTALLTFEDREGASRVRLLQVVRTHLLSRLDPARKDSLSDRAARCSLTYLEKTGLHCWKPVSLAMLANADVEGENFRFAWRHLLRNDPRAAVRCSPMIAAYESTRARSKNCLDECLRLRNELADIRIHELLALELSIAHLGVSAYVEAETTAALSRIEAANLELDASESAAVALASAICAFRSNHSLESDPLAEQALQLAEAAGNRYLAARCHQLLSNIANYQHDQPRCLRHLRQGVQGLAETGAEKLLIRSSIFYGAMLWHDGQREESDLHLENAANLIGRSQDPMDAAYLRESIGRLLIEQRQFEAAIPYFEENLRMWRAVDCAYQEADQLHCLSKCYLSLGDLPNCLDHLVEAADQWKEDNNEGGLCASLGVLAAYWVQRNNFDAAREVVGFAHAYRKEFGLAVVQSELNILLESERRLGGAFSCELPLNLETAWELFHRSH